MAWQPSFGSFRRQGEAIFRVWAPDANGVELLLEPEGRNPLRFAMEKDAEGFFSAQMKTVQPGALYRYQLAGKPPWPDPASRYQPQGIHGPSQLIDPSSFRWSDILWEGVPREELVLYEMHVGTFTPQGTFSAATDRLPYLRDLGITAVELMPLADFPGSRNWGYDGAALFAPARCYGTPDDLRRLVDIAHQFGIAVHLDVVYNHLGPDGAYLPAFSPFVFSEQHRSPWGAGINFDGPHSEMVRRFFIENALHWIHEYHIDGLRLDATHAIADDGEKHFLAELSEAAENSLRGTKRKVLIIAEDERNLSRIATPRSAGGWGLDGAWADDFHHQIHTCLTGEHDGYYEDFSGSVADIATTVRKGWFYCGQHAQHFGKPRGTDPCSLPPSAFVVCLQNHDQIGNRAMGERLNHLIDPASYRAAAVLFLLAPEVPLLFMGQEWASSSPFQFFTDHNPELGRLVTEGRRREFAHFAAFKDPEKREKIPDPQDANTFTRSKLDWGETTVEPHSGMLALYKTLLHLRSTDPACRDITRAGCEIFPLKENGLLFSRKSGNERMLAMIQLRGPGTYAMTEHALAELPGNLIWDKVLMTEDAAFTSDPASLTVTSKPFQISFTRPGAVLFRSIPKSDRGD